MLREWRRVLRPGGRALFTDPVVITGPVTNDELARRSSIGLFVFLPAGLNEALIDEAGLRLIRQEDVTANAALVAGRWHQARAARRDALLQIEGEARFAGLQTFFQTVHDLTRERPALAAGLRRREAGLSERPVDAEVDAALAVLLLGLRERREAARHAAAARCRRCRRVTPLNSSETNVNAMSSRAVEPRAGSGTARRRSRRGPTDRPGTAA